MGLILSEKGIWEMGLGVTGLLCLVVLGLVMHNWIGPLVAFNMPFIFLVGGAKRNFEWRRLNRNRTPIR
jgi:hypothetical protein